jgi:hypothetical protein
MVFSRLNLVILAVVAGAVVWIEHAQHIKIEVPPPAELANAVVCPENESVPFSADCMIFIQGGAGSDVRPRVNADAVLAESPELP